MPKKIAVLAAVLVLLCLAIGWFRWRSEKVDRSQPWADLKESDVAKIEIFNAGTIVILENSDGSWKMTAPDSDLADPQSASDTIKSLAGLTVGSEVAEDPSSYEEYQINDSSATHIKLFSMESGSKPILDAYFGKTAMGFNSVYLRLANQKPVYLATGISRYLIAKGVNDYRDRAITPIAQDAIKNLHIETGKHVFDIEKSSSGWIAGPRTKLSPANVTAAADALVSLRLADFIPINAAPKETFAKPELIATISSAAMKTRWILGKTKPEGKNQKPYYYYAKIDGRDSVVLLAAYDVDSLLKALKP